MGEEAVGSLGLPRVWSTRPDQTTDLGGLQAATLLHSCFFFFRLPPPAEVFSHRHPPTPIPLHCHTLRAALEALQACLGMTQVLECFFASR